MQSLKEADPTLINLSRVCDELLLFVQQQENESDLASRLDSFAIDLKLLNNHVNENLHTIGSMQKSLQAKIDYFNSLEGKYTRMITRIHDVLDELERVLKKA